MVDIFGRPYAIECYTIVIDQTRKIKSISVSKTGIFIDYGDMGLSDDTTVLGGLPWHRMKSWVESIDGLYNMKLMQHGTTGVSAS